MELIYSKIVDKSVLWDGFSIQGFLLTIFTGITGRLAIGERRHIKIMLNGKAYDGIMLKNQPFSRDKYPNHKEMYQVRYSPTSDFSKALRTIYADIWQYIKCEMELQKIAMANGEKRRNIRLPEELHRKLAFYTTDNPDVWLVETYGASDNLTLLESLQTIGELEYEQIDVSATIHCKERAVKLRILDHKIGDNLKKLYSYRCQVCGQAIGEPYGNRSVIDAHHIEPFTHSMNNNYDNIMILCPNHHRIIHAFNGEFHRKSGDIWYPNGFHEPLKLNIHL